MIESMTGSNQPRTAICTVGPNLDFRTAVQFRKQCDDMITSGYRYFILDLSRTGILDSSGLGAIFSLYRRTAQFGGCVMVASSSKPVQIVFDLTKCNRILGDYPSVQAALQALSQEAIAA